MSTPSRAPSRRRGVGGTCAAVLAGVLSADPGRLTRNHCREMPDTEVPGAPPIFGFREDGTPR